MPHSSRVAPVAVMTVILLAASLCGAGTLPYSGSDLRLWLRADGTVAKDVAPNADRVLTWSDQTGVGGNTVADNGDGPSGNRPLWVAGVLKGLPVVRFDSGARRINGSASLLSSGTAARTVIVVAKSAGAGGGEGVLIDLSGNQATVPSGAEYALTKEIALRVNGGNRVFNSALSTTGFDLVAVQTPASGNSNNTTAYLNGTALGVSSTVAYALNTTSPWRVGGTQRTTNRDFQGDIAEILVFESALNASEMGAIGNYLTAKYALNTSYLAATATFDGGAGADTNWATPANWDQYAQPLAAQDVVIAAGKTATVTSAAVGSDLSFADNAGTIQVSSSSLSLQSVTGGLGTINVRGGTLSVATGNVSVDAFKVGTGAAGTYTHAGGSFQANTLTLGVGGDSTFTQNGGTVTVGDLRYGAAGSDVGGAYALNAGTLQVNGQIIEDHETVANAQIYLDGGALNVTGNITVQSFRTGYAAGRTGSYTLSGGKPLMVTGTMFTGLYGTGTFTVDDPACTITVKNRLQVGDQNNGSGTFNLTAGYVNVTGGGMFLAGDGTNGTAGAYPNTQAAVVMGTAGGNLTDARLSVSGQNLEIGRGGKAGFTQHSGTVEVKTNNLVLGQAGTAEGTYTLNGGKIDISSGSGYGQLNVGNTGKGTFIQNGGQVFVDTILQLGTINSATSQGYYTMSGGTLDVPSYLIIGKQRKGEFTFLGGSITLGGPILIGGADTSGGGDAPNADGKLTIGSATHAPTLNANQFEIGRHKKGVVDHIDGTVNVNGAYNLVLSQYSGGNATYNMMGGTLNVLAGANGKINFNQGTGLFDQTGGLVHVQGGSINLTSAATGNATYRLRGGTLDLGGGSINPGPGSEAFLFQGGTLKNVGTFGLNMLQEGGTLAPGGSIGTTALAGSYTQQAGGRLEIEIDGLAGPGVAGGHDVLRVAGAVTIEGVLDLVMGFDPPEGAVFEILLNESANPVAGQFLSPEGLVLNEGVAFYADGAANPFRISYLGGTGNDVSLTVVPEPASLALLGLAGAGLGGYVRRRRR